MADTPKTPPPEDMHWGVSYLREDLQDLRHELRDGLRNVHGRVDQLGQHVDDRFDQLSQRMDARFAVALTTMVVLTGVVVAALKI